MIIDKLYNISIGSKNFNHFKKLNYNCKVGETIEVNSIDLMSNCKVIVNAKCDICGTETSLEYRSYLKNVSKYPIYCCSTSCSKIKEDKTKKEIYGEEFQKIRVQNMKKTNKKRYGNECSSQIFRNEKNQETFITELKELYKNNDFDYSKVNYINNYTKVEIICKDHGSFEIIPNALLIGQGCKKCNKERIKNQE